METPEGGRGDEAIEPLSGYHAQTGKRRKGDRIETGRNLLKCSKPRKKFDFC